MYTYVYINIYLQDMYNIHILSKKKISSAVGKPEVLAAASGCQAADVRKEGLVTHGFWNWLPCIARAQLTQPQTLQPNPTTLEKKNTTTKPFTQELRTCKPIQNQEPEPRTPVESENSTTRANAKSQVRLIS